jgi:hypothetical protein
MTPHPDPKVERLLDALRDAYNGNLSTDRWFLSKDVRIINAYLALRPPKPPEPTNEELIAWLDRTLIPDSYLEVVKKRLREAPK